MAAPRVRITQELIDRACRADSSHCMIAEAIKAQVPDATHVSVDIATIRYTRRGTGRRYIVLTPRKAQVAIIEFDQGRPVPPFSIRLDPAQVVQSNRNKRKAELGPDDPGYTPKLRKPRANGSMPVVVGGNPPPTMTKTGHDVTGRRRVYGRNVLEK